MNELRVRMMMVVAVLGLAACGSGASALPVGDGGPSNPPDAGGANAEAATPDSGVSDDSSPDAAEAGRDAGILDEPAISALPASRHEHEPSIAVAPNGHVLVAWESYPTTPMTITVGYRISGDFGATWGPATLLPLRPDNNVQGNATAAADDAGDLFLAWGAEMVSASGRSHQRVFVASAGPADTQLGSPIEVTDPSVAVGVYDRPSVAVTSSGVSNVLYTQASTDLSTILIFDAVSTDHGMSWTRTAIAGPGSPGSFRNVARICQPQGAGTIFVSWYDDDVNGIALNHSADQGKTWSSVKPLLASLPQEINTLTVAGTNCVTHGNDVWVLYALSDVQPTGTVSPALTHLRLAHSGDQGATIDAHADVAETQAGAVTINPAIVGEDSGSLDLAYYAGKAANDTGGTFRRSRSTDGSTFAPSVLVHGPVTIETSRAVPQWIGDYVNVAFRNQQLFLVYTDNASATPHINFYRTAVP